MYTAVDLSKYIVSKCYDDGYPITNLQLQKILYYIQREYLQSDAVAFSDSIESWRFGPVVADSYYHFCGFGAMPITTSYSIDISPEDAEIIDKIVEDKRVLKPWDLVAATHKPGGAWDMIYNEGKGDKKVIPEALIKAVG